MQRFVIQANEFLRQDIQAFYHTDYVGYRSPGNPDYINIIKNTYNSFSKSVLVGMAHELSSVLLEDLPQILPTLRLNTITVCVVPRAKTSYQPNQLLFKATVRKVVDQFNDLNDGADFITRHTNTRTTHLPPNTPNYNNDGDAPYPGITRATCNISVNVRGKNIILIDDLYTRTVNIDEDAAQALIDNGANSVVFYSVGKTVRNRF